MEEVLMAAMMGLERMMGMASGDEDETRTGKYYH